MGRTRTGSILRGSWGAGRCDAAALAVAALLALTMPAPAWADGPVVGLRVGAHPDHVRLVFDCPRPMDYTVEEQGQRVILRLSEPTAFRLAAAARSGLRNIGTVQEAAGGVAVEIDAGTRLQHFRLGNRIVLDVYDARGAAVPRSLPGRVAGRPALAVPAPVADAVPVADPMSEPASAEGFEAPDGVPAAQLMLGRLAGDVAGDGQPAAPADEAARAVPSGPAPSVEPAPAPATVASPVEPPAPAAAPSTEPPAAPSAMAAASPDEAPAPAVAAVARPPRTTARDGVRPVQPGAVRGEARTEPLPAPPVLVGAMMLATGTRTVMAAGTWSLPGGEVAHPVNRSRISCSRDAETCVEAAAYLDLGAQPGASVLSSEVRQYRILSWTAEGILAERHLRCATQVLVLRPREQRITLADRPHATPLCRFEAAIAKGVQTLGDGAEPIARFFASRSAGAPPDLHADSRAQPTQRR